MLDRLSGSLCDAVTGEHDGRATLEGLDRANLFLVPLDDSRHWYRYHHLFADMLQAHLRDERPGEVADLHRRASRWYDQNGQPSPAVRHALAAGDIERAADLVERAIPALQREPAGGHHPRLARRHPRRGRSDEAGPRGWLHRGVDGRQRVRGRRGTSAGRRTVAGAGDRGPRWGAGRLCPDGRLDEEELARLPGAIELYRAALALIRGDAPATLRHARLTIDRATADDHVTRAGASALSGLALWGGGDLEAAHRAYSTGVERLQRAGHISDVLGCSITLADIRSRRAVCAMR